MRESRTLDGLPPLSAESPRPGRRNRSRSHRTGNRAVARDRGRQMTDVSLIDISDLKVVFHGDRGRTTHAVNTVNIDLARGATLGLVGESGCGKSVTALAIMGLLPKASADVSGNVRFDGVDL